MAADRENINMRIVESINESISLTQASGPVATQVVPQGFGLTEAGGRVSPQHLLQDCAEVPV